MVDSDFRADYNITFLLYGCPQEEQNPKQKKAAAYWK